MPRSSLPVLLGAVLVLAAGAAAWWAMRPPDAPIVAAPDAGAPAAPDARPDILLFTVDTLRADHVGAYGYARPTTPVIDALAARGTRFGRAYATASWTAPSVASMLSGVLPSEHGVLHGRAHGEHFEHFDQEVLSAELPSLALALSEAGYRTGGVTANAHLVPELGFARGFDAYRCLGFVDVAEVEGAVREVLAEMGDGRPRFLWVHVLDPHAPYVGREPWLAEMGAPARRPELEALSFPEDSTPRLLGDPAAVEYLVAAYDSEIRAVDAYLGQLIETLDDGNLAVVVTADHGEAFGEHGTFGHGHTLYEHQVRVPLVVATPRATSRTSDVNVSLVDLLPTLLEIASVPVPAGVAGRSLGPALVGEALVPREVLFETSRDVILRGVVDGDLKYGESVYPIDVRVLFDLGADPGERTNLFDAAPERAAPLQARMAEILGAARDRRPISSSITLDGEALEHLRALGYATGGEAVTGREEVRPPP